MKCFELHSGKWIIVKYESTLYCALFSKALLKCIKILPGEILDRICGQSLKETGDCSHRSKQLQQLIFELLLHAN